jgi:hypothetical protein
VLRRRRVRINEIIIPAALVPIFMYRALIEALNAFFLVVNIMLSIDYFVKLLLI